MLHIIYHFTVPALLLLLFFRNDWKRAYFFIMLTMLVDLDHLLADPVYDPMRCSINFHPLHGFIPMAFYGLAIFSKMPIIRYAGVGLVIHMALDSIDCQFTNGIWYYSSAGF